MTGHRELSRTRHLGQFGEDRFRGGNDVADRHARLRGGIEIHVDA